MQVPRYFFSPKAPDVILMSMVFFKVSLILISNIDISSSFICFLLCNHPLCLFSLLNLLRLSMAKSKIFLGKCHIALENMWVFLKYLLILISNIIPQQQNIFCIISILLNHEIFAPFEIFVLRPYMCSSVFWFIVYKNLSRICILLLCENCINLMLNWSQCFSDLLYPSTFLSIDSINF